LNNKKIKKGDFIKILKKGETLIYHLGFDIMDTDACDRLKKYNSVGVKNFVKDFDKINKIYLEKNDSPLLTIDYEFLIVFFKFPFEIEDVLSLSNMEESFKNQRTPLIQKLFDENKKLPFKMCDDQNFLKNNKTKILNEYEKWQERFNAFCDDNNLIESKKKY
jgi:hypothetical protein